MGSYGMLHRVALVRTLKDPEGINIPEDAILHNKWYFIIQKPTLQLNTDILTHL
jgi:hypothetical protein